MDLVADVAVETTRLLTLLTKKMGHPLAVTVVTTVGVSLMVPVPKVPIVAKTKTRRMMVKPSCLQLFHYPRFCEGNLILSLSTPSLLGLTNICIHAI